MVVFVDEFRSSWLPLDLWGHFCHSCQRFGIYGTLVVHGISSNKGLTSKQYHKLWLYDPRSVCGEFQWSVLISIGPWEFHNTISAVDDVYCKSLGSELSQVVHLYLGSGLVTLPKSWMKSDPKALQLSECVFCLLFISSLWHLSLTIFFFWMSTRFTKAQRLLLWYYYLVRIWF